MGGSERKHFSNPDDIQSLCVMSFWLYFMLETKCVIMSQIMTAFEERPFLPEGQFHSMTLEHSRYSVSLPRDTSAGLALRGCLRCILLLLDKDGRMSNIVA